MSTYSVQNNITAVGTNAATAKKLLPNISVNVVTIAAASTGVQIPFGVSGQAVTIINNGANNINLYPQTGYLIDAASSIVLDAGDVGTLYTADGNNWTSDISSSSAGPGNFTSLTVSPGLTSLAQAQIAGTNGLLLNGTFPAIRWQNGGAGTYTQWNFLANPAFSTTCTIADVLNAATLVTSTRLTPTQTISKTTGVPVDGSTGTITTVSLNDAAGTSFAFIVTNVFYKSAAQVIQLTASTAGTGTPYAWVSATVPGSNTFTITVANINGAAAAFNNTVQIYFSIN